MENLTINGNQQRLENYTPGDIDIWGKLFNRQLPLINKYASVEFIDGLKKIGFNTHEIPSFGRTNEILMQQTGWQLVAVPGIVDDQVFFELMADKKFPATTWLRNINQLDYLEEPDMFHDVFAHVPLLVNEHFAEFLQQMSVLSLRYHNNPMAIELLARVYWYTVEFGLIKESDSLRIYGAGILSSPGETAYSVGMKPMHFEFNIEQLIHSPLRKDHFQDRYFFIDSFEQLYKSLEEIPELIDQQIHKNNLFAS